MHVARGRVTDMGKLVDRSGKSSIWLTPERVLAPVRAYFGGPIPLDPCTQPGNPTKALRFFTEAEDGLAQPWDAPAFVNPPYSRLEGQKIPPIRLWVEKIHREAEKGQVVIALLPCGARFSTGYWQQHALVSELRAWCFVRGRVNFLDESGKVAKGNLYDSAVYGFGVDPVRFARFFTPLGRVFKTELLEPPGTSDPA